MEGPSQNGADPADGVVHTTRLLLDRISHGDEGARSELFSLLYSELHRIARNRMRAQIGISMQPTALINEVFLRLAKGSWNDRKHFLLSASRAMHHVLIDHARARERRKRQASRVDLELDEVVAQYQGHALDLEGLDGALTELGRNDPEMAQAVYLRFFAGLPAEEIVAMLGLSQRTYERRWALTRAWLYKRLR